MARTVINAEALERLVGKKRAEVEVLQKEHVELTKKHGETLKEFHGLKEAVARSNELAAEGVITKQQADEENRVSQKRISEITAEAGPMEDRLIGMVRPKLQAALDRLALYEEMLREAQEKPDKKAPEAEPPAP